MTLFSARRALFYGFVAFSKRNDVPSLFSLLYNRIRTAPIAHAAISGVQSIRPNIPINRIHARIWGLAGFTSIAEE